MMGTTWRLRDSPLGCSMSALLQPPRREVFTPEDSPTPAACHPNSGLLLLSEEVLTHKGGLLMIVMRVEQGSEESV